MRGCRRPTRSRTQTVTSRSRGRNVPAVHAGYTGQGDFAQWMEGSTWSQPNLSEVPFKPRLCIHNHCLQNHGSLTFKRLPGASRETRGGASTGPLSGEDCGGPMALFVWEPPRRCRAWPLVLVCLWGRGVGVSTRQSGNTPEPLMGCPGENLLSDFL